MASYLYSVLFGSPEGTASPTGVESQAPAGPKVADIQPTAEELILHCNRTYLEPKGFVLRRDSSICYQLRSSAKNETHLLYVKPVCYPNCPIQYEIGNRELLYPHIQTAARLQERMKEYGLDVYAFGNIIQFGKEDRPLYLYVDGTELILSYTVSERAKPTI